MHETVDDPERFEVRRAVEAAVRAEAQAVRAHRRAMVLSLRAAVAHEEAARLAGRLGLEAQAELHAGLAGRAREAVRTELGHETVEIPPPSGQVSAARGTLPAWPRSSPSAT